MAGYRAQHFLWQVEGSVATLTLNRPERKNPLTFESYAELRDLFERLRHAPDVKAVVITWRRRQLLQRRRRARDHRPAGAAEGARAADVHAHDR
jgi:1,4-dihydroxy-2-naphthoyl-CoA synthase